MNLFHWLAGADKNILNKCSNSEKTKIAGFGTLVLIPAIVGLFSMTYAISTITSIKSLYFLGVLFGFLLYYLLIDSLYQQCTKPS